MAGLASDAQEPPPNLRPTCLHNTPCPRAKWVAVPWGWICEVCHPAPKTKEREVGKP